MSQYHVVWTLLKMKIQDLQIEIDGVYLVLGDQFSYLVLCDSLPVLKCSGAG